MLVTSFGASLAAAAAGAAAGKIGGTLNMVIWDGYDDKQASGPFRKQYGVKTQATYIGNNEQIFTKLRAGGVGTNGERMLPAAYVNASYGLISGNGSIASRQRALRQARTPSWVWISGLLASRRSALRRSALAAS